MKAILNLKDLTTIEQIAATLRRHRYRDLGKADRGLLRRFLERVSGYSRATVARLIQQYGQTGHVRRRQRTNNGFQRRFVAKDIRLLAQMDELHERHNGYAMKKLCERAFEVFGDARYERLATISVAHLYRLRKTITYRQRYLAIDKTRPTQVAIGERRVPQANGQPGFLRVDSVHQGDLDKRKGVYHINAVDEVTQYEIVVTVERISEQYLIPALESLLEQFPFTIRGFHTDNGSEYVNRHVAKLLNKLLIEFT